MTPANRQRAIENALASLLHGDVPDELRPLAEAVRAGDARTISNAALALEDPARFARVTMEADLQWIAGNPRWFGVERLAKCDVRRIYQTTRPDAAWPKDERGLWKRAGLDELPEGRGTENERALAAWEKLHAKGHVTPHALACLTLAAAARKGMFRAEFQAVLSGETSEVIVTLKNLRGVIRATVDGQGRRGASISPLPMA
jgi:hypothetical protein